jgi:hypothetical protein
MGPIELFWAVIVTFFVIFGVIRGYGKELGVTLVILVALFILTQFGDRVVNTVTPNVIYALGFEASPQDLDLLRLSILLLAFIGIVFAAYQGETLSFQGIPRPGVEGFLLSAAVGLINGYLVAGTLWYYLDVYHYPLAWLVHLPLSPLAQSLLPFLPPQVLGAEVLTGLIALLVLLRVRR